MVNILHNNKQKPKVYNMYHSENVCLLQRNCYVPGVPMLFFLQQTLVNSACLQHFFVPIIPMMLP